MELVLETTLEEFGRSGYAGMRVDEIAARSGVNKTTIYRRWPTKDDLVVAAIQYISPHKRAINTGSLRSDLLAMLHSLIETASTPKGLAMLRALLIERSQPAFMPVLQRLRSEMGANRRAIFERAVARGELPQDTDIELVGEVCFACAYMRLISLDVELTQPFMEALVDLVIAGAKGMGAGGKDALQASMDALANNVG